MKNEDRRLAWARRLALACTALMLAVVSASAWLRLTQPRGPCVQGPRCVLPAPATSGASAAPVRAVHRAAASAVLVALVALLALTRYLPGAQGTTRRVIVALLVLALGLAALGVVTPGSRAPAVMLGNLLGGLAMFALSWALARQLHAARAVDARLRRVAVGIVVLWLIQAALGAAAGAAPSAWTWPSIAHLLLALAAAPMAVALGVALRRRAHAGEGNALLVVTTAQVLLGAAALVANDPAFVVLLHNACAASGCALLAGIALAATSPSQPTVAAPHARNPTPSS